MHWKELVQLEDLDTLKKFKSSPFAQTIKPHFYLICREAARHGKVSILTEFKDYIEDDLGEISEIASSLGHVEIFRWLKSEMFEITSFLAPILRRAAENGKIEILRFIHLDHNVFLENVLLSAAQSGHVECVQFLYETRNLKIWHVNNLLDEILDLTIRNGHCVILDWIYSVETKQVKYFLTQTDKLSTALEKSVEQGHLNIIKWLRREFPIMADFKSRVTTEFIYLSLVHGHQEQAVWLMSIFSEFSMDPKRMRDSIVQAIQKGHISIIPWAFDTVGFESNMLSEMLSSQIIHQIIRKGDLSMLRFLFSRIQNFSYSNETLLISLRYGQVKITNFLFTGHISIPSSDFIDEIAKNGHLNSLIWIHTNYNHHQDLFSYSAMDEAAAHGHLDIVQWLDEFQTAGCSDRAMDLAATNGHLEVVEWLHLNRLEGCTSKAWNGAAENGHLEVLKWLYENRFERCTNEAFHLADANGHLHVLIWLHGILKTAE